MTNAAATHDSRVRHPRNAGGGHAEALDRFVSGDAFREAMAQVATPVSVVTTMRSGTAYGTTVSAFLSLSMQPPMVLVSLAETSKLLGVLEPGSRLGVNVLAADQYELASRFATKTENKFAGIDWYSSTGIPRFASLHVWIAGTVSQIIPAGDHMLVLVAVEATEPGQGSALTYWRGNFGTHQEPRT